MSVNFLDIDNKNQILFNISDSEFSKFENIIKIFNNKYDNLFDIYGDFRLYQNHINYLIELLEQQNVKEDLFYRFLLMAKNNNKTLLVIGN